MSLILKRGVGQSITIGPATVIVRAIGPSKVKLEIQAPKEMAIARGEVAIDEKKLRPR
jgi:sRNA-binding carbon storage regulator CsrA